MLSRSGLVPIIAIGASGGDGLNDIEELLALLPDPLHAVVMVVLHRPTKAISQLQLILARCSLLPVEIANHGQLMRRGIVYIGQPTQHLTMIGESEAGLVEVLGDEHRNRTVDLLFHAVARHAGPAAIGIILSGSLDDGARGLKAIHHAQGTTMVLTPGGEGSPGMPENAIAYDGPIDVVGSAETIAAAVGARLEGRVN